MTSRSIMIITFFLMVTIKALGQATGDTTVVASGRILNKETQQPIEAKITFMSLPYGNRIGVFHSDKYSFPMFDGDKYSILVEAQGFAPAKYMLDPREANGMQLLKDIELEAGGPEAPAPGEVMLLSNLIFEVSKAKINPESYPELDIVVAMMNENDNMIIQLEGHTDYTGNENENMKLSKNRVNAVKDYLVSKGIDKKRIYTKAFGGTMPLSRDDTPEAHRMNRRVELRILSN